MIMKFIFKAVSLVALVTVFLTASAQAQSWLTNGLVAYYPFNGNANNIAGSNDFGGTISGTVSLSTNRFNLPNSSYRFSGVANSALNFGNPPWLNGSTNASWSWWIATTNTPISGWVSIFRKRESWLVMQWAIDAAVVGKEYRAVFNSTPPNFVYPTNTIKADGKWCHLCLIYDGQFLSIFRNGFLVKSQAYAYGGLNTNSYSFMVGGSEAGNENFNGWVDDIRIYNRALSSNEVAQLYVIESGAPLLGVTTYSNSPVVFYPTASGTNFTLQMATNLNAPIWLAVTNGEPFSGVRITNAPPNAFFRLN